MIMSNIKNLVHQALVQSQGYIPSSSLRSTGSTASTMPSNFQSHESTSFPAAQRIESKVTNYLYASIEVDSKSIQLADLKNAGCYDQVKVIAIEIYSDHQRNLGNEHLDILTSDYEIVLLDTELSMIDSADRWANWIFFTCQRTFEFQHSLSMKSESLRELILLEQGRTQQANAILEKIFARQQDIIDDDHLDTLNTQLRLAEATRVANRREDALTRLKKRSETLSRLLEKNHIRFLDSMLNLVLVMISELLDDTFGTTLFSDEFQQATQIMTSIQRDLRNSLESQHLVVIRALRLSDVIKSLQGENTEASNILRRAFSNVEDALDDEHLEIMNIVLMIAVVYHKAQGTAALFEEGSSDALPWLQRYLEWVKKRRGLDNSNTRVTLRLLGHFYMSIKNYVEAEKYIERLIRSYEEDNSEETQKARSMLQLCNIQIMITRSTTRYDDDDIVSFLFTLKF